MELRLGFVPLLDAAPLIAALELGYFAEEGLNVVLEPQIGWGNVRDKLTFGQLHASHALLGMPAASAMHRPRYPEPLVGILSLGFGGNAITISRRLFDAGVTNATALAAWIHSLPSGRPPPLLAHVFDCSTHHYLLRDWLSKSQIDPDCDVQLCVLPPSQMVRQMCNGYIDGFCVGEPWNSQAAAGGCGTVVTVTTDIVPAHPEKVLAVTRRWLSQHSHEAQLMVRALLRAADFCANTANRAHLCQILAKPQYLAMNPETLSRCFALRSGSAASHSDFYGISPAAMFPSATHVAWLLSQMDRWGHLNAESNVNAIAAASVDSSAYRTVAASMGFACPADEFPPMRLRNGWFAIQRDPSSKTLIPTA